MCIPPGMMAPVASTVVEWQPVQVVRSLETAGCGGFGVAPTYFGGGAPWQKVQ